MKKKRVIIALLTVCAFALFALMITSLDLAGEQPRYTIFNNKEYGTALFYDTLREMGYKVAPEYEYIKPNTNKDAARIIIQPDLRYFSTDLYNDIMLYIKNGGRVMYFSANNSVVSNGLINNGGQIIASLDDYLLISYGLGEVFTAPLTITNGELIKDNRAGRFAADILNEWRENKILFNEAYHGFLFEPNFWNTVPSNIKNAVYQAALAITLIVLMLGKRFGKPRPYCEETEREENEYLIALANLYNKAGHGNIVYQISLSGFIKKAERAFGLNRAFTGADFTINDIYIEWEKRGLPYKQNFAELLSYNPSDFKTNRRSGRKRLMRAQFLTKQLEECL